MLIHKPIRKHDQSKIDDILTQIGSLKRKYDKVHVRFFSDNKEIRENEIQKKNPLYAEIIIEEDYLKTIIRMTTFIKFITVEFAYGIGWHKIHNFGSNEERTFKHDRKEYTICADKIAEYFFQVTEALESYCEERTNKLVSDLIEQNPEFKLENPKAPILRHKDIQLIITPCGPEGRVAILNPDSYCPHKVNLPIRTDATKFKEMKKIGDEPVFRFMDVCVNSNGNLVYLGERKEEVAIDTGLPVEINGDFGTILKNYIELDED